ncbi:PEP-CTERM sorting domain-containing protein [Phenylobacterium sp.]|uniref:PEP-CTERM sorting domain-containing protein n=1 Tax=Phenylobacterium sp. TaxID=1871053 RepID=UPI0025DF2FAA|nr:PEP-CTERM sorting domain-containing protein [Phenylobacterium sp.]MBX3484557.1 PEP-CTERM sorting domain-containing protein [Phenylobacterium sp.]MCW5758364.1 PEP-CTERM sorting domain-containing protein [Phenylobacterium sp.]
MAILNKALLGAAAALALSATTAQAATVMFAAYDTGSSTARNLRLVRGSGANADSATIYTTATATATSAGAAPVLFSFLDEPSLSGFTDLAANFTLTGTVTHTAALFDGNTYTQTGINGQFQFVYAGPTTTINGFNLVKDVSVLFSGTFTNAWIQGFGGVGGLDVTVANGGSATFNSAYYDVAAFTPGSDEFTFKLATITAPLGRANANSALNSFRAHMTGSFQADAVPEPGAWALMIGGFFGSGAMLRSRRRRVHAA